MASFFQSPPPSLFDLMRPQIRSAIARYPLAERRRLERILEGPEGARAVYLVLQEAGRLESLPLPPAFAAAVTELKAEMGKLTRSPGPRSAKWLTTAEAAKRFSIKPRTLERMKTDAEAAGVKVPCKAAGRGTQRHKWIWNPDKLDGFMEDQSWRQSDRVAAGTSSRGATSAAPSVGERVPRRQRRASSSSTSKRPFPSGATGSLMEHYEKLTSKR